MLHSIKGIRRHKQRFANVAADGSGAFLKFGNRGVAVACRKPLPLENEFFCAPAVAYLRDSIVRAPN
jgi:hypothetical protein